VTVRRACLVPLIVLLAALLVAIPASADTFKPTRFDDPEPGKCKAKDCSLREAMKTADDHPGHDNVVVRPGRYELELPGMGLYEGSLDLVQGVTLRAKGRRNPTIDVNGLDQVITAWANGTSGESFEIRGLTLTGGVATPVTNNRGGAISTSSEDKFALDGVTIKGNSASQGGGVANHSSTLTITDSKIRDNEAGQGGGIYLALSSNSPSVVIRDSLVAGNEASFGGGIYSLSPKLTIQRSTIDGNAADEGGGLDLVSGPTEQPMTAIRASTISGNTARKGGGILADGNQPSPGQQKPVASLVNSTLALNHTSAEGGGIMADNAATVTLDQATIAYNTADDDNVNGGVAGGVYQHSGAIFSLADSIRREERRRLVRHRRAMRGQLRCDRRRRRGEPAERDVHRAGEQRRRRCADRHPRRQRRADRDHQAARRQPGDRLRPRGLSEEGPARRQAARARV
jgi:Right handed beta helix region